MSNYELGFVFGFGACVTVFVVFWAVGALVDFSMKGDGNDPR